MFSNIMGHKLYYRIKGRGKSVLILHGGLGLDHRYLYNWFLPLSKYFKLYFIDLPGNGLSSKLSSISNYNLKDIIRIVEEFRKKIVGNDVCVIGHSYGALLSFLYVAQYPKSISKVVSISTPLSKKYYNKKKEKEAYKKLSERNKSKAKKMEHNIRTNKDFEEYVKVINPIYFYNNKKYEKLYNRYNKTKYNYRTYSWSMDKLKEIDNYIPTYKKINTPILAIHGVNDAVVSVNSIKEEVKKIDTAIVKLYNKCGHLPFVEYNTMFVEDVVNFFKEKNE